MVGQRVGEILIRHGGVREHACAWMTFSNGMGAMFVGFQVQRLRVTQVRRCRIEPGDERGGVGFELRWPISIAIHTMTVVADAFPVEDGSTPLGISCRLCALG